MGSERSKVVVEPRLNIERNHSAIDRWIVGANWIDRPAEVLQHWVLKLYQLAGRPGRSVKDVLHGTRPLGHPLHPVLSDVPLGAFSVMVVADWLAIFSRAISPQIGVFCLVIGILGMVAAAAAGYTDYAGTFGKERRYAAIHGVAMTLLLLVMILSLVLRRQHSGVIAGVLISTAAYAAMLWAAYLGGHLTFVFGTMVNHNAFLEGPTEWTSVGTGRDFAEGKLIRVKAGEMAVLVVRLGGRLNAIAATCCHAGGPLEEGKLAGDIVTCPWHGSRFCVADGRVLRGPAAFDQPALLVREEDDQVQVRLPAPLH
jgi:nitrite reductase/ring-hydroxylating ferredoxin subunit/uncharacterized membrane protein